MGAPNRFVLQLKYLKGWASPGCAYAPVCLAADQALPIPSAKKIGKCTFKIYYII